MEKIYRVVEETDEIRTGDDAEMFVFFDSGKAVFPVVGSAERISGGWRVECFSLDGRPRAMEQPGASTTVSVLPGASIIDEVIDTRERERYHSIIDEQAGWTPYFSKPKDAGKE
jgi:hypothetical protein